MLIANEKVEVRRLLDCQRINDDVILEPTQVAKFSLFFILSASIFCAYYQRAMKRIN